MLKYLSRALEEIEDSRRDAYESLVRTYGGAENIPEVQLRALDMHEAREDEDSIDAAIRDGITSILYWMCGVEKFEPPRRNAA